MKYKLNKTGTHIHKGKLKVRVDIYPDPEDKTYLSCHVQVPIIPEGGFTGKVDELGVATNPVQYNKWYDALPKEWVLNPCLCHFIVIDENDSKEAIDLYVKSLITDETLKTIDDTMFVNGDIRVVMKDKLGKQSAISGLVSIEDINLRITEVKS